jgi:hypothetical protein
MAPDWLRVGDVVRIEVEQLGFIKDRVVPGPPPFPIPLGRRRIGNRRLSGCRTPLTCLGSADAVLVERVPAERGRSDRLERLVMTGERWTLRLV